MRSGFAHMRIRISKQELNDLAVAWFAVSLAFSIILLRSQNALLSPYLLVGLFLNFVVAGIAVGFGFVFHELAHKITAEYYGCAAEFRAARKMLWFGVLFSFFGFVFIAPGAVVISGHLGRNRNGKISLAGPLANIVIALMFLAIVKLIVIPSQMLSLIASYGFRINSWLALFNMIPFFVLDGKKIFDWNKWVWGFFALISVILVFFIS